MSSDRTYDLLFALHILGFILWMGGLIAVSRLLTMEGAAAVARRLAMLPDLGAVFALAGGGYMLLDRHEWLLKQPYMHIKLTLVVVVLGLHGFTRVKAKRLAEGGGRFPAFVFPLLLAVAATMVVIMRLRIPAKS